MFVLTFFNYYFVICNVFFLACALPRGPALSPVICDTLEPLEHMRVAPADFALDYEITTEKDWFGPEEVIPITISSRSNQRFRGFMVQVVTKHKPIAGSFVTPPPDSGYQVYNCHEIIANTEINNTMMHSNPRLKESVTLNWLAPPSCKSTVFTIKATVVKRYDSMQAGIEKIITCQDTNNALIESEAEESNEVEEIVHEPRQCLYTNLTNIIGQEFDTSFESRHMDGWVNSGWVRNKGKTFTMNTGPNWASDRRFYMHYEASLHRQLLLKAILRTYKPLRGCFCIKLKHHHNVDDNRHHKFSVQVGSDILYQTTKANPRWQDVILQVDIEDYLPVEIIASRGDNYRGDTAIDNIRIVSGWCGY